MTRLPGRLGDGRRKQQWGRDVHSPAGRGQQRGTGIWHPGLPGEKGPGAGRPRCKTRPGQWKQSPFLELHLMVQRGALLYWTSKPLGFSAPWFSLMRRETDPISWSWVELGAGWYVDSVWELEHCGSRWPGRSGDSFPVGVSALHLHKDWGLKANTNISCLFDICLHFQEFYAYHLKKSYEVNA